MKKKVISITISLLAIAAIGVTLANNKAKINKAAQPVTENKAVPVKVQDAKEESFSTSYSINGSTSPDKEVKVASEVQGKLVRLHIKNGDMVFAGQPIATLDASVYSAQLNSIDASIAKATLDLARYTRLNEMGGATAMQTESVKLQLSSLQAERKSVLQQMAHMQIRAPFSGRIENLLVETGSFVSFGTLLCDIIDNSTLKIKAYLSEQQAFDLKKNQEVIIHSAVLVETKKGVVTMVSDKADASGKFLAEIKFSNAGKEKLKAGMLVEVAFNDEATENGLAIPVSSIVGSMKEAKVYVLNGSKVQLRNIKTGIITADKVQVTEGLTAGEQVVVSGQINLENGALVLVNK